MCSATSWMKVSGQLVTGMPLAVAARMSTMSVPTLPRAMILQFSSPLITFSVTGIPLTMRASASFAVSRNSSSDMALASISLTSTPCSPSISNVKLPVRLGRPCATILYFATLTP